MSENITRGSSEDPNSVQLGLIREIREALTARSNPHWLSGGWALDFLFGEVSRVHGDVDWAIWKTDAPGVTACLGTLGYSSQKVRHPEEHIGFYKHDQYVSFGLLEKTQGGDVVTSGRWTDWPYRTAPFVHRRVGSETYSARSSALRPNWTKRSTFTSTQLVRL